MHRDARDVIRIVRPFVPEPRRLALLDTRPRERVEQAVERERPVDEQQVEPVAHAEPVEARLHERARLLGIGRRMHVEDAAALGVRERAHSVLCRESRERGRRLAAAAQDDERDEAREHDERAGSLAIGRPHEADGTRRQPGFRESGTQHLVDDRRDRAQRGAAGAE